MNIFLKENWWEIQPKIPSLKFTFNLLVVSSLLSISIVDRSVKTSSIMNMNFPADIMCRGQEISALLILTFDLLICPILFQSLFLLFWLISVLSLLQKEKCSNSYFGMVQYKIYDEVTRISIITDWHSENSRKIWGIGIWMSQSFMYVWISFDLCSKI